MTRQLEGLTFTETEQVAENQLGVDTKDELLNKKEKEIEDLKRTMEDLQKAKTTETGNKEKEIEELIQIGLQMLTGGAKVGH